MNETGKPDDVFLSALEKSKISVDKAARFLADKGFQVLIEPTIVRDDVKNRAAFSDNGDLKIMLPVEVKQRPNLKFNKKEGFPFKTIIVNSCYNFDRHRIKPIYYIIYNSDCSSLVFINVKDTQKAWVKVERFDSGYQKNKFFYEVDIKLCHILDV